MKNLWIMGFAVLFTGKLAWAEVTRPMHLGCVTLLHRAAHGECRDAPRRNGSADRTRVERVRTFFAREIAVASREFANRGSCADERLITAIVATEVGGLPTKAAMAAARGGVGEIGPMQIHPKTAAALGMSASVIAIPENNFRAGIRYFCDLVREWGSIPAALAAYNAGSRRYTIILMGGRMPHELEYPAKVARHAAHLGFRF